MPERRRGFGSRINQARDVKCVRKSTFAGVSLPGLKPHALRPRAPRQTCYQSLYCFSFLVAGSSQGFRRGMTGAWPGSPTSVLPGALLACVSGPSGVFIFRSRSYHFPPAPYRSLRYTIWLPVSLGGIPAYRSFLRMALPLPVPALILLQGLLVEPLPRSLGAVVTTSGRRLAATPLCCSGACLPWASSDHPVFPSPFSVSAPPFQL